MLTGVLLKDKKSIRISGDCSDLAALQQTIAKVIQLFHENQLADTEPARLFTDFQEKIKTVGTSTCTELLIIFNLLLSLSDYLVTDLLDHVNLLLLENILQTTTNIHPTGDPIQKKGFIGKRFVFNNLKSFIEEFTHDKKLIDVIPMENKPMKPS